MNTKDANNIEMIVNYLAEKNYMTTKPHFPRGMGASHATISRALGLSGGVVSRLHRIEVADARVNGRVERFTYGNQANRYVYYAVDIETVEAERAERKAQEAAKDTLSAELVSAIECKDWKRIAELTA